MVSLFDVHCFEQLNVDQCFGSCFGRNKRRRRAKRSDSSSSSDESNDSETDAQNVKSKPATAKRRFSSVPQAISDQLPLTDQLSKPQYIGPRTTPAYYGVTMQPRSRYDNAQVVSIRRRRFKHLNDSDSSASNNTSVKHIRVRPRPWDQNWTAKAPRQPLDFGLTSDEYSICLVNLEKVVSHISGLGFTGMMRHPGNETPGQTIAQIFTAKFADLMILLFETSVAKSTPSAICVVCDNTPRNIISYPIIVKNKLEGLMFLWHESSPHQQQQLAEMITSA